MRFDGKNTKRRAKSMRITELSGVTLGAHEGADVTIMKFQDQNAEQLLKSVYTDTLREEVTEDAVYEHLEPMWQMNRALRESAETILLDSTITDKQAALRESVMEYLNDVLSLFSITEEAVTMANENKELETVQSDLIKAQAEVERLTLVSKMSDASKAHYDSLTDDAAKADFLKLSADDQKAIVKMSQVEDETYTTATGAVITKSQAGGMFDTLKSQDVELRKLRDEQNFTKAREEVVAAIPNVPGEATAKVKAWQGLSALPTEQREYITSTLKAADELWKARKAPAGDPNGGDETDIAKSADAKLQKLVDDHMTTHKVNKSAAIKAVMNTTEGAELYAQTRGK